MSKNTINTMQSLHDEIGKLKSRNTHLIAMLESIARNAPVDEPRDPVAWSYWVAGQKATALLEAIAND